jgi:hypothetical protein
VLSLHLRRRGQRDHRPLAARTLLAQGRRKRKL